MPLFTVTFSGFYASLPAVGYTVLAADGSTIQARTTSGVVSLGGGAFQAVIAAPPLVADASSVLWDDGLGNSAVSAYNVSGGGDSGNVVVIKDDLGCG